MLSLFRIYFSASYVSSFKNKFLAHETASAQNLRFLRIYNNNKRKSMIIDLTKKQSGRPKKPDMEKASRRITMHLNEREFKQVKFKAEIGKYKSLSRFIKDYTLDELERNTGYERYIIHEIESRNDYIETLRNKIEDLRLLSQNIRLPAELTISLQELEHFAIGGKNFKPVTPKKL